METFAFIGLFLLTVLISTVMVIQVTVIRNLKEKIREMDEEMGRHYSNAAEADRDLRQELHQAQINLRWLEAEIEVRKFLMRDPQRMRELHQIGHLDRQGWLINRGTELVVESEPIMVENTISEWWEDRHEYSKSL